MKRLGIKRSVGIILMMAILGISITYGVRSVYATINNDLPAAADMEAGGKTGHIELHLKNLDVAQVVKNKMSAYYPKSDTSANGKSIKITAGPMGRVCNVDKPKVSGKIRITITVANNSVDHDIPIDQVCDTDKFYSETFMFPNGTLINDPGIAKTRADISVNYLVTPRLPASSGSDLNYEMHLTGDNSGNGLLALQNNNLADQFGLRSSYASDPSKANNNDVKFRIPFGYPCNATFSSTNSTNREVKLYDADAVFGDTYMWIEKNGSKISLGEYGNEKFKIDNWDGTQRRWKLYGSNNEYNMLSLNEANVEVGARYELVVLNNGNGGSLDPHYNTFSVGIPQDSIYSRGNCEYMLIPRIEIDTNSYVYYPSIRVTGSIVEDPTFNGPIPEAHPWEMYGVRYSGEPATRNLADGLQPNTDPCTNGILPNGGLGCGQISPPLNYTANPSYAVNRFTSGGPDPVGTRLCFFTRVKNPTHLVSDNDQWVYSDMVCSVSLKKPRVQFRGSDLRVAGNVRSSSYLVQGTSYGSWSEYGLFLSGVNSMTASGAALRNGSTATVDDWNKLTFANRDSDGNASYGYYSQLPAVSSAYAYFTSLPRSEDSLNAATIPNGVYNVGGSVGNTLARLPEAKGGGVVLVRDGNFTISNNIIVDNAGRTSAREITQLVIVADNITIDENVTRVDAWLVTPSTGTISTCQRAFSNLNSGVCNQKLTVNGAIHTGKLLLRRTAGANPPGNEQLREPAEVFNLRPDAQLWAYMYANKADYAQTDYIQELPPRY